MIASRAVHPDDYLFQISQGRHHPDLERAIDEYLGDGAGTAEWFKSLLTELHVDQHASLLDFASGYGRVTRHFPALLPDLKLTASDIHPKAVGFLKDIGIDAIQSSSVPEEFEAYKRFNVILALSFFTHMPANTWARWLKALSRNLSRDGLLIFTTHGVKSLPVMNVPAFGPDGFHFDQRTEQRDISASEYGSAANSFAWAYSFFADADLRLVRFVEAGLAYQDLYVAERIAPSVSERRRAARRQIGHGIRRLVGVEKILLS